MNCSSRLLPYEKTGSFSGLVLDYLRGGDEVRPLFSHDVSFDGLLKAIEARKSVPVNRKLLTEVFSDLYSSCATESQQKNIDLLLSENTFTICTAHQPNIFTGYLYFVYKILHVIRISNELNNKIPDHHFVPVYYIGSEDNDLEELGQVKVEGAKLVWQTRQTGAVGRMKVDKSLLAIIDQLAGQLGVRKHGDEVIQLLRNAYREGVAIADATKTLVDSLFSSYGLLVLNADDARLKELMKPVFRNDLLEHEPYALVSGMGEKMGQHYKVQVNPREINLFYLVDGIRERIIEKDGLYTTESGVMSMNREELLQLLDEHPDRFSPNVVLRAVFQETILPDIAFVGGGSEIAYWLEMKPLFDHFKLPFPVLVLRNSFMIIDKQDEEKLLKFNLKTEDMFAGEFGVMDKYVKMHSTHILDVEDEKLLASKLFEDLREKAGAVDASLIDHISALETRLQKQLDSTGKKILRAEKRKYETGRNQIMKIRAKYFPGGSLQERVENFMPFYADLGAAFIDRIYEHSPALDQQFVILSID